MKRLGKRISRRLKALAAFLWILTLLLPASCGQETAPETDWQYYMSPFWNSSPRIQETAEGCLFFFRGFIYSYQSGSGIQALCSKPGCLHDKESSPEKRSMCHAFLKDCPTDEQKSGVTLMLDRDDLYVRFVCERGEEENREKLIRIALCGDSQTEVFSAPFIRGPLIHRGYLYYYSCFADPYAPFGTRLKSIHRLSLRDGNRTDEVLLAPDTAYTAAALQAYDHWIYISMAGIGAEPVSYVYDTENGSAFPAGLVGKSSTFFNGRPVILTSGDRENTGTVSVYENGPSERGSGSAVIRDLDISSVIASDGRYLYVRRSTYALRENFYVYDREYRLVDTFFDQRKDSFLDDAPICGESFRYIRFSDPWSGEWGLYVWDKKEIGSLNGRAPDYRKICAE